MDVADLRLVDAVAERGSFTAAAAQLRMSQPSVSARVARVERALGAVLFIRDPRGTRLTEAGTAYLGYVRRCLRLLEDGGRAAAAHSPAPPWRIGLPASYAPALTPLLLEAAAAGVRPVTVSTGDSRDLRTAVLDGRLDLAVAHPGPLPVGLGRRHLLDTSIAVARRGTDPGDPATGFAVHRWASDATRWSPTCSATESTAAGSPSSHPRPPPWPWPATRGTSPSSPSSPRLTSSAPGPWPGP